jgi:hypothetical protein
MNLGEAVNQAFQRSNIAHRVKVAWQDFSWNYPKTSMINDVKDLSNSSEANNLRNSTKADLVVMLTNYSYSGSSDLGYVADGKNVASSSSYAIVSITKAAGPYSVFAHEIGHLLGARHQHAPTDRDLCDCPAGWEIITNRFYTIMHTRAYDTITPKKFRVLNYSDPKINFRGYKTGHDGDEDENGCGNPPVINVAKNAGVIRSYGCTVAQFQGSPELSVIINGNKNICTNPQYFQAMVTPPPSGQQGQPPYSYEWRWNLDGIFTTQNPGTLLSSTNDEVAMPPQGLAACQFFFLKVKATSGNIFGEATIRIENNCEDCDLTDVLNGRAKKKNLYVSKIIELSPNPVSRFNLVKVQIKLPIDSIKAIKLVSIFGSDNSQAIKKLLISGGQLSFILDESITPGVYIFQMLHNDRTLNLPLIINE